ncbi:DNA polymerase IV [Sphingoaurantiacus capsulatus]|uniref:DNA polymerase IV n=1 Tax=Sphingoaurantiacus capsulatus TaxID=1771310 RepID=A0ABV7X750_9SPHN
MEAESPPPEVRKIIHVDMDAFFASVEQRDAPELRGKPVAVGGSSMRGVVAAASYEARKFGVRSAMPSVTAKRLCPDLIFVKHRFDVYKSVSRQIRDIFESYTPLVEPLSLDEAYLDVTENLKGIASATEIAREIKDRIKAETGLTASAGVSYNKFLAKLASDYRKPDGLYVIRPEAGPGFVEELKIGRFHGIGPKTAEKFNKLGIFTGADLKRQDAAFLQKHFGRAGLYYHSIARGIDHRSVKPHRERKSVGSETTFFVDIGEHDALAEAVKPQAESVWRHCERVGLTGRTVTLKIKYADFQIITRSKSGGNVADYAELERISLQLVAELMPLPKSVRLVGVTLSNLAPTAAVEAAPQLSLAI